MPKFLKRINRNSLIWIIFIMILMTVVFSIVLANVFVISLLSIKEWSYTMQYLLIYYGYTIVDILMLVFVCLKIKENRFIFRSFLPSGMGKDHKIEVTEDTYKPSQNNTFKTLLIGMLIGTSTLSVCVLCAVLHKDINLNFAFDASQIPMFILAFLMVMMQSSSEELWYRGFMYERINVHYPLWVSIAINGVYFALLHTILNSEIDLFALLSICISGISFSFLRWYSGSIWLVMGSHTMWNFTQSFIFGLPNSGTPADISLFHLGEVLNTDGSLFYDPGFGVEGALPSLIVDLLIIAVILLLAKKNGRFNELFMSHEKKASLESVESEKQS